MQTLAGILLIALGVYLFEWEGEGVVNRLLLPLLVVAGFGLIFGRKVAVGVAVTALAAAQSDITGHSVLRGVVFPFVVAGGFLYVVYQLWLMGFLRGGTGGDGGGDFGDFGGDGGD